MFWAPLPCNAPAVAIVGWIDRSDTPIRMCAMCADHNIRNRGGYQVSVFDSLDTFGVGEVT